MTANGYGPAVDGLQMIHATQRRTFSRTALADNRHYLAPFYFKRHAPEHLVLSELLVHIPHINDCRHSVFSPWPCSITTMDNRAQNKRRPPARKPEMAGTASY